MREPTRAEWRDWAAGIEKREQIFPGFYDKSQNAMMQYLAGLSQAQYNNIYGQAQNRFYEGYDGQCPCCGRGRSIFGGIFG